MLKILIALVLMAHGIGHSMGPLGMFNIATINPAWHGDSWILSGVGPSLTQVVGTVLWTLALVGFIAVGAVVLGWLPADWWVPLAVGSSLVSIAGIILFPVAFPVFSTLGALAVDVVVLAAALWLGWTPSDVAV
ncbi:MAG TPA: hypothetical protein VFV59_04660 [Candidatus Limnocylindria bacterium]|nr:hypothetical protein [Candidatus Limnocylindria bacterium]